MCRIQTEPLGGQTKTEEKTTITCSNKACNKVFEKPLRTINLQYDPKVLHDACPYCLQEIPNPETINKEQQEDDETPESDVEMEKPTQDQEKSSDCKHHFGYLNEKERTKQIPDECITCPEIIDCMMKN